MSNNAGCMLHVHLLLLHAHAFLALRCSSACAYVYSLLHVQMASPHFTDLA